MQTVTDDMEIKCQWSTCRVTKMDRVKDEEARQRDGVEENMREIVDMNVLK